MPQVTTSSEEGQHTGLRAKGQKEDSPNSWSLPVINQGACAQLSMFPESAPTLTHDRLPVASSSSCQETSLSKGE